MAKWHLNKATGDYNKCTAKPGKCPIGGGDEQHFNTKKEAQQASESFLEEKYGSFSQNSREVKETQTKQVEQMTKICNQLDDTGYRIMSSYSNLVVRSMVEDDPQQAKRFMDEIVKEAQETSVEFSPIANFEWKMGTDNLPETIQADSKDKVSQRLKLLYKASDFFDDQGIDVANDHSASILLQGGPFNKENEQGINNAVSEFAQELEHLEQEGHFYREEDNKAFRRLMSEYYSVLW